MSSLHFHTGEDNAGGDDGEECVGDDDHKDYNGDCHRVSGGDGCQLGTPFHQLQFMTKFYP